MKIGQKTNSLTLIKILDPKVRKNGAKRAMGIFRCDCGDESVKALYAVRTESIMHCKDCGRMYASKNRETHGLCKHPLYSKWNDMKNRCYNKKVDRFEHYGGRGIKVCDEWVNDFQAFFDWAIKANWQRGLSIERKNIDKDYMPSNCVFITMKEQSYNKRNSFLVNYNGNTISLIKFLTEKNLEKIYSTIWHGMKSGKSFDYYIEKYNL